MPVEKYILQCGVCKSENYTKARNRKPNAPKLSLKKYCPVCRKHTDHAEARSRSIRSA
jgi:large subunit ribosomal protein L33